MRLLMSLILLMFLAVPAAWAVDDMPAPKKAPRTPVTAQKIESNKKDDKLAPGATIISTVEVLDGEKLKLQDSEIRLFGIVPPQLSASFGPQARARLDELTKNVSVSCKVRDRDRDGRLLATCGTEKNSDLALVLLQDGLAVVARGSVRLTDVADLYAMAETQAQNKKLGLWATSEKTAAADKDKTTDSKKKSEAEVADKKPALTATAILLPQQEAALPSASPVVVQQSNWALPVWLLFIYIIAHTLWQLWQRGTQERQERRTLAAALRGELQAARAICQTKSESLSQDIKNDPRGAANPAGHWPRLRTVVYQAHVGRIGVLGADLSRKVASLYGQFADYAAYVGAQAIENAGSKANAASVRTVLLTLMTYIDLTMQELEAMERANRSFTSGSNLPVAETPSAAKSLPETKTEKNISVVDEVAVVTASETAPTSDDDLKRA
jgi:endonuclease YncB( thermonuclease family)